MWMWRSNILTYKGMAIDWVTPTSQISRATDDVTYLHFCVFQYFQFLCCCCGLVYYTRLLGPARGEILAFCSVRIFYKKSVILFLNVCLLMLKLQLWPNQQPLNRLPACYGWILFLIILRTGIQTVCFPLFNIALFSKVIRTGYAHCRTYLFGFIYQFWSLAKKRYTHYDI